MGSIGFRPYNFGTKPPPIMENQMDKNVENEMKNGVIKGFGQEFPLGKEIGGISQPLIASPV